LREILEECPNDLEFTAALNENDIIIKSKQEEVIDLKLLLQSIDPAYYIENRTITSDSDFRNQHGTSHDTTVTVPTSNGIFL
jgi:hypothetical protein